MTPSLGIEPGPHWWEASALATTHVCRVLMRERQMMKGEWDLLVILIVNFKEVNPCYVTI